MRRATRAILAMLAFVLVSASVRANDKNRDWKDAKVAKFGSTLSDQGTVSGSVGTTTITGHVESSAIYYWLETPDITYIVAVTYNPLRSRLAQPNGGHPLNITLNGKTKISLDGTNAHILDDAGKDVKVPVVLKIARAPAVTPEK